VETLGGDAPEGSICVPGTLKESSRAGLGRFANVSAQFSKCRRGLFPCRGTRCLLVTPHAGAFILNDREPVQAPWLRTGSVFGPVKKRSDDLGPSASCPGSIDGLANCVQFNIGRPQKGSAAFH
jgi:hypothetical protein